MKKTFLGAALTGLVLLAPVISEAAGITTPDPSQTYYAPGYGTGHYAMLDYQDGLHLKPTSPINRNPAVATVPRDSTLKLLNQTGGGG